MTCLPPALKTHPLYRLRRALLFTTLFSYLFATVSISTTSDPASTPYIWHLLLSTLSALLNIYELGRWAVAKFHDPDTPPTYPLKRILAADVGFAAVFAVVFSTELGVAASTLTYYSGGGAVAGAYASMASLLTAVLHAICAWRQLMALKRIEWEAGLGLAAREAFARDLGTPCVSCGARGEGLSARGMPTPLSSGGLDLASGYEVIPDKMPEAESSVTGKRGKASSRAHSQNSLMEV